MCPIHVGSTAREVAGYERHAPSLKKRDEELELAVSIPY
jgi:hypothetical protein